MRVCIGEARRSGDSVRGSVDEEIMTTEGH
jgi:hypothetical protein